MVHKHSLPTPGLMCYCIRKTNLQKICFSQNNSQIYKQTIPMDLSRIKWLSPVYSTARCSHARPGEFITAPPISYNMSRCSDKDPLMIIFPPDTERIRRVINLLSKAFTIFSSLLFCTWETTTCQKANTLFITSKHDAIRNLTAHESIQSLVCKWKLGVSKTIPENMATLT